MLITKTQLVDARDKPLAVGDLVCYTTNSRGSGLQFGTIYKVYEDDVTRRVYDRATGTHQHYDDVSYRVSVTYTTPTGGPIYQFDWDPVTQQAVETDIVSTNRSGVIAYDKTKFLKL